MEDSLIVLLKIKNLEIMTILIIVVSIILWVYIGQRGFVYHWTSQYDFTGDELVPSYIIGLAIGPLSWILGYFIHPRRNDKIIKKKRD